MTGEKHEYADVRVGDLVEVERGERLARGRVLAHLNGSPWIEDGKWLASYISEGFTIRIIERAAPPLPTKPGPYLDCDDDIWRLYPTGKWEFFGKNTDGDFVGNYLPLRRLVPEVLA